MGGKAAAAPAAECIQKALAVTDDQPYFSPSQVSSTAHNQDSAPSSLALLYRCEHLPHQAQDREGGRTTSFCFNE